jgi:enoyl-CoA hydratase
MSSAYIRVEKRPPIAVVTLDRPKVRNAISDAMLTEIDAVFDALRVDADVRVILLTSSSKRVFCSGIDLAEVEVCSAKDAAGFAVRAQEVFRRMEMLGKPILACIEGYAIGGACELTLACAIRLASSSAQFSHPEVKVGIIAGYGGTQRLPRLVGRGQALRLLLSGEIISAKEALRIGLVDEVVPAKKLMKRAEELALAIASNAPLSVAATIEAVNECLDWSTDKSLLREAERFGRVFATEDKIEGARAFREKRKPVWKGK